MASPFFAEQGTSVSLESRIEFFRKIQNMVSLLESTDTIFFHKHVSKSMATEVAQGPFAYSLDFPLDFIKQHGKKFDNDVTFLMKDSERTWPIKLTERSFKRSKPRVFAHGPGGWKTFLMDNRIKVGDVLIFTLLRFSQFEVVIGRAPVEVHLDACNEDNEDEDKDKVDDKSSAKWNADQGPPCPRFLVAVLYPRHVGLDVLGRFWDLYGNMLKCDDLQLRGPNKAIFTVKAKRTYEEKLSVCLESGWEAFFDANKLRVGDILRFSLVGNSCFTVDLPARIKN